MIEDFFIACWLSFKQVTRNNKKSVIMTIIMVALLYVNILFVTSLMTGVMDSLNHQMVDFQYGNIVIEPNKKTESEAYLKQVRQKLDDIQAIPGIVGAVAHSKEGAKVTFDPEKDGNDVKEGNWMLYAIDPQAEKKVLKYADHIVSGRYLENSDRGKILLGREITGGFDAILENKSLKGVRVGDEVFVHYSNSVVRKYEVAGIFATKNVLNDVNAFITQDEYEDIFGQHDIADEMIVRTETMGGEEKYVAKIENVLGNDLVISSWDKYTGAIASMTNTFDVMRILFYGIGLLVAGASIFIIIYINLLHQRKQIGILRAIGMENKIIIISYTLQALFYGIIGIILGRIIVEQGLYTYFIKHPLDMPIGNVSLIMPAVDILRTEISIVLVAIIAGFIPSFQTTKNKILDLILK
jgi:putative ABC transport system permease protein